MADDDEIDILGDFSFNSCLAQNSQGIPSCSNREDTVHPQWLMDSTATNWYDTQSKDSNRVKVGPSRKLSGYSFKGKQNHDLHTTWSQTERDLLVKEMAKYGRNIRKISQTVKTKSEAEIQALIEAEFGVHLETPSFGLDKPEENDDVPAVVQEEIVTDDMSNVLNIITTGSPTIAMPKQPFRKKTNTKSKRSLLKPDTFVDSKKEFVAISPSEIFYEDDLIIGSTESIGSDLDSVDVISRKIFKQQKEKMKAVKKIGNHRRKVSRNHDRGRPRNKSKDLLKSPQRRQRKDSSLSEDNTKSPKMQIVFSSGQALPVSEGEQVIKIEKKKDSEPESDIEIDVDSDNEDNKRKKGMEEQKVPMSPVEEAIVPKRKFEKMPKRPKKINLDGGGGYTIMHTEAGDLYEIGAEPRKERPPKKQQIHLIQCRVYNAERPAPYEVRIHVSTLISMDAHAHTSRGEVMGLAGGRADGFPPAAVTVTAYRPAAAAACSTHCDMDPVSQAMAAESIRSAGLSVCAWHHSHPAFPPTPSALDLRTQRALQQALEWRAPLLGLITSQHWPPGRTASQYRCIRVEETDDSTGSSDSDTPTGYQFSVKLVPDLTEENMPSYLCELRGVLRDEAERSKYSVDMSTDICPQAGITYLEKCISSITHHMRSAGYESDDEVTKRLLQGLRDVFR